MDRRQRPRFSLSLPLRYRLISGWQGQGVTLNMSGGGVAFRTDRELHHGELIELYVAWPVLAYGRYATVLQIHGSVLRSADSHCAVLIIKREFHILRPDGPERSSGADDADWPYVQ